MFPAPALKAASINATNRQFATGQAAIAVVGQTSFSANVPGANADQLGTVTGLAVTGNRLIVCDGAFPFAAPSNHRVLIYNNLPAAVLGATADVVIGHPDFGKTDPGLSETQFNRPIGVSTDGQRLAVADSGNNRILIFNRIPSINGVAADVVAGQSDFKTNPPNTTVGGMRGPNGVFLDGRRLLVADTLNHRVLIFNSVPSSNGAKADIVLGQADFNGAAAQAPSATSLRDPTGVFSDGLRLVVTDLGHNRVLIYNRIPTSNNVPADVVVGQPDFTTEAAGAGPSGLNFPRYAFIDGGRLFIADGGNNRILVFNQVPTSNGAAADAVLGQKDFQTSTDPQADDPQRLTAGIFSTPVALAAGDSSVLVADAGHRRVLKFSPGIPLFPPGAVVNVASFDGNGLQRPTGVNVDVQTDGSIPAGTYFIKVAAEGGILFESAPSDEVSVTVPDKTKLVVTFDEVPAATSYRAYLGGSPGGQGRFFKTATPASGEPIDRTITITTLDTTDVGGPRLEITPGSISALFGQELAPDTAFAGSLPLPTELAGVTLFVNGTPAPLFFVSPTQINFQVPWATVGSSASLVLQRQSGSSLVMSNAVAAPVSDLTPGLFTVSGDGTGRLLAFHSDFTPVNDDNPVVAGEDLIFFGTGVQSISQLGDPLATASLDSHSTGQITVTPQGDISWSTSFVTGAQVYVSVDGGGEALVAEAPSGSATVSFISAGHVYVFNLRAFENQVPGDMLASVTLDTTAANPSAVSSPALPSPTSSAVLPGATPDQTGAITVGTDGAVTWSASGVKNTRVYVSTDGGVEGLFAENLSGTQSASFVTPGHVYRFTLRPFGDTLVPASGVASPANVLINTTDSASIQGRDAPIQFGGLAPGMVGLFQWNVHVADDLDMNGQDAEVKLFVGSIPANLTRVPVSESATGTISVADDGTVTWSTTAVGDAQVTVSVDGGDESLFAKGISGSQKVDFIAPGHIYIFTLRGDRNGVLTKVLATFTLDTTSSSANRGKK